ncbi:MAG: hypothetical protein E6J53_07985 [Chloroflexi bacterium]|nr:MAG: hypothetical protein E6J53_07985 [Chloroflexota bacterium]
MRFWLALVVVALVGCGSAGPGPSPVGTPLSEPQLKFAVMDAGGKPAYCDPDFYPVARAGGEERNAVDDYPAIRADTSLYSAIVAHEHVGGGDLSDAQKLVVYKAWKLLRALQLSQSGNEYSFQYRAGQTTAGNAHYQMVSGTVRVGPRHGGASWDDRLDAKRGRRSRRSPGARGRQHGSAGGPSHGSRCAGRRP